jgi:hypothetical protein
MQSTHTPDAIPDAIRDLLTNLIILDRQTGQPSVPPTDDAAARRWLIHILLDVISRKAHVEKLKVGYGGKFRIPRPHWERPYEDRIVPDPASGFQWFDLLPEDKLRQLLDQGPSPGVLDSTELARLLLNPFALWDLAERIDAELPPWWWREMDAEGKASLKESGIRLRWPEFEAERTPPVPTREEAWSSVLAGMGVRQCRVPLKPGHNCWDLSFSDDAEDVALRRAYADLLYGDPEKRFTLRLFAHRPEEENAPVPFSLEVEPAPTRGRVTVQLEFRGGEVRSFVLEPPETFPGVDAPESYRSARCALVPVEALTFTTITWGDHTDDRHLLRGLARVAAPCDFALPRLSTRQSQFLLKRDFLCRSTNLLQATKGLLRISGQRKSCSATSRITYKAN